MEPTTHLYLIRHGEAWAVKTRVVAGMRGDAGLTPLGQEQARRLRDRLRATSEYPGRCAPRQHDATRPADRRDYRARVRSAN